MIVLSICNVIRHDPDVCVKPSNVAFAAFGKRQPHRVSVPFCKVILSLVSDLRGLPMLT